MPSTASKPARRRVADAWASPAASMRRPCCPSVPISPRPIWRTFPTRHCMTDKAPHRCGWARSDVMIDYHDREWGVPQHDDVKLFEFLILEGAQAGLSWETVLRKRENYRKAFANFDPRKVARFDARKQAKLMLDPGII